MNSGTGRLLETPWLAALLALVCLACLVPFSGKAFHIDDPLFVWSGQHIQTDPVDFYGSDVNWFGRTSRMSGVMQNPPGFSYFLALWASLFGWSESSVHWGVFLFACATAIGVYVLAGQLGARRVESVLVAIWSPVFLLSATTAMCDSMMVCFWVWSLVLWLRGLEQRSAWSLVLAVAFICVGALTKYFAISLLPLLLVYTLAQRAAPRAWALLLVVPVLVLVGYEAWTHDLYGDGLIAKAAAYAAARRAQHATPFLARCLSAFSFAGGSLAPLLFFIPCLWKPRAIGAGVLLAAAFLVVVLLAGTGGDGPLRDEQGLRWGLILQLGLFVLGGVHLLALALSEVWRKRDAEAWLLALWVGGTFVFAGFLYHFVAGRTFLPLAPAVGLLIGRRLGTEPLRVTRSAWVRRWLPLLASAVVAVGVTWSDFALANSVRVTARQLMDRMRGQGKTVWFQGHWGFQYYMEAEGAEPIDYRAGDIHSGHVVVIPINNTNLRAVETAFIESSDVFRNRPSPWIATMNSFVGAGFYSDVWGPAPYVLARVPPERYHVIRIKSGTPSNAP